MDLVSPQAADIAKVSLVSLASVTHTADWNQHFVDLPFTRTGGTLTVDPASANLAPPNYYMVFAVTATACRRPPRSSSSADAGHHAAAPVARPTRCPV